MPIMQERNSEAQMLGSVDHLFAEDRNYCAEWYDNAGSAGFIAAITVPLGAVRHNFFPELYTMSAGVLTVLQAGFYLLDFAVQATKAGTTEGSMYTYLEEDPATTVYAEVPGSRQVVTTFSSPASTHNMVVLRAQANYKYRVRAATFGVQFTLLQPYSKLTAIRLFKA